jgi:hypothetical protein
MLNQTLHIADSMQYGTDPNQIRQPLTVIQRKNFTLLLYLTMLLFDNASPN